MPLRERNRILLAAGYAPAHPEHDYLEPALSPVREALSGLLAAHEPNPAVIVDRLWNIVETNRAAALLTHGVDPTLLVPPINALRLGFHPGGLPSISTPSTANNIGFLQRLHRQAYDNGDNELLALLAEVEGYLPAGERNAAGPPNGMPLAAFELHTRLGGVRLFSVIATLGAPTEVTSAALAIETFLPADPESAQRLRLLARTH